MEGSAPPQPFGPDEHKAAAAELGLPNVRELLVLAAANDPFYKGTPAHRRDGEWFADLWRRFGYTHGVHLRRAHYQLVSTGSATSDGKPYENTDGCWKDLCAAGAAARILGLVDVEAFVDRRNPDHVITRRPRDTPAEPSWRWNGLADTDPLTWGLPTVEPPTLTSNGWLLPWVPFWQLPTVTANPVEWRGLTPPPARPDGAVGGYGYDADDQPVLVEVWVEKSTMQDVLGPLCWSSSINLVTGVGNLSITAVVSLLRRAQRHGKPAHVLYISDFDPSGEHMPAAVARQAQFWRDRLDVDEPLTLAPLILTREQVDEYQLPRVPIKDTDLRAAAFEARNGVGAVELDALEALHPGVLAGLVRSAAAPYTDRSLRGALSDAAREAVGVAEAAWRDDTVGLRADLAEVERGVRATVREYEARLDSADADLAADLAPERRDLDELAGALRDALAPVVEPFGQQLDDLADRVKVKTDVHRDRIHAAAAELVAQLDPQRQRLDDLAEDATRIVADFAPDLPDRPQPADPAVDRGSLLYDSDRHWLDQLDAFKARR